MIPNWSLEQSILVLDLSEVRKEMELLCMLSKLRDTRPVKPMGKRAGTTTFI